MLNNENIFNEVSEKIQKYFEDFSDKFFFYNNWQIKSVETIIYSLKYIDKINKSYAIFSDKVSKDIFEWVIKRRLSYAFVGDISKTLFPYNNIAHQPEYKQKNKIIKKGESSYEVKGYIIDSQENELYDTWLNEQYLLEGKCEPEEGDIIISAGALFGETSIWFADKIGKNGKVFAFEPSKINIGKLNQNIKVNGLQNIIQVIKYGLWSDNTNLYFTQAGGASFCDRKWGKNKISAITIDYFIENQKINKVDYLKMDIEGAELDAIKGACKTITKYKPKLAICVYHLFNDIFEIPLYIKSLVPEYNFYLSQKKDDLNELVLFAVIE